MNFGQSSDNSASMANAETEDEESASFNRGAMRPGLIRNKSRKIPHTHEIGGQTEPDSVDSKSPGLKKHPYSLNRSEKIRKDSYSDKNGV